MRACGNGRQKLKGKRPSLVRVQICLTTTGLNANTRYELVLPAGTSYSTVKPGSILRAEQRFKLTGILDFTTTFIRIRPRALDASDITDLPGTVRSAVLELWYPHGFAAGTDVDALRSVLTLQEIRSPFGGPETPQDVDFTVAFRPGTTCVPPLDMV